MILLLNQELLYSMNEQTLLEFLLYSKISYDSDIHPTHNKDWVKRQQELEKEKFEEFLRIRARLETRIVYFMTHKEP